MIADKQVYAVGATPYAIRTQFLAEATLLSSVGSLLGSVVVLGVVGIVTTWLQQSFPIGSMLLAFIVSFLLSAAIGILFGCKPASNASRLSPVAALRSD